MRLLTTSRVRAFGQCTELDDILYERGYRPVHPARALVFGTSAHKCLEIYWLTRWNNETPEGIAAACDAALDAIDDTVLDPFECVRLHVMLRAYGAVWGQTAVEVLGVEMQFEMPLVMPDGTESRSWTRAGKIDLYLRSLRTNRKLLVEHKTSAEDVTAGSDYRQRLAIDEQCLNYWQGAASLGLEPDDLIYDILKKPRLVPLDATSPEKLIWVEPKYLKQTEKNPELRLRKGSPAERTLRAGQRIEAETPEEYMSRLEAHVQQHGFESMIERVPMQFTQQESRLFELQIARTAQQMIMTVDLNLHARRSQACFEHGRCSFFGVCRGTESLEDQERFVKLDNVNPELAKEEQDEYDNCG